MDFLRLLPQDLVFNHILNRLDFICRVRAGAVCRAWRDLSRAAPPIAGMPWICHPTYDDHISARPGTIRAHSLINISSSTTRYPRCRPITNDQRFHGCRGSGPNLTLTSSDPTSEEKLHYTIYNPFTGDTFQLPCTVRDQGGLRHPMSRICGTQLSSKPPNCVVAVQCYDDLCICRPGDDDWMEVRTGTKSSSFIFDMIFYKGELYCIDEERIMAYDIQRIYDNNNFSPAHRRDVLVYHKNDAWSKIDEDEWRSYNREHYLVDSGGELLVVRKYTSRKFYYDNKIRFTVHRVDQEQRRLVPMDGLGDHRMLFVGRGCSQSWSRLMNKDNITEPYKFFTENSIYFFIPIIPRDPSKPPLHLGKICLDKEPEVKARTSFELHPEYCFDLGKCGPVWIAPTYPN